MKGKNKSIRFLPLAISVILLMGLFGTAGTAFADEDENSEDVKSIPPGQLVRNGLSGPVVAINVTSGYFLVETKLGIVQVYTDEDVANMTGHRVAAKLGKVEGGASMFAHNGTDNQTGNVTGITANGTVMQYDNLYRVATALQFKLIPSKGSMKHEWGFVESSDQGCVFVNEEGNQIPGECGNSGGNVIGLVGGPGNGVNPLLLQTQQMSRIISRIQLRLEQAEDDGDTTTQERLEKQLEKFKEKQLQLEEKRAERAAVRAEKAQGKGQK